MGTKVSKGSKAEEVPHVDHIDVIDRRVARKVWQEIASYINEGCLKCAVKLKEPLCPIAKVPELDDSRKRIMEILNETYVVGTGLAFTEVCYKEDAFGKHWLCFTLDRLVRDPKLPMYTS